jgi:hypothetical protein
LQTSALDRAVELWLSGCTYLQISRQVEIKWPLLSQELKTRGLFGHRCSGGGSVVIPTQPTLDERIAKALCVPSICDKSNHEEARRAVQILRSLAKGATAEEIRRQLGFSVNFVEAIRMRYDMQLTLLTELDQSDHFKEREFSQELLRRLAGCK